MTWPHEIVTRQKVFEPKLAQAKEFRRKMTTAERMPWHELRDSKLGVHFRRQQLIGGYIVDFYTHASGLIIEVEGPIYDAQGDADAKRSKALADMCLTIPRFTNDEVLKALPTVLKSVMNALHRKQFVASPSL